MTHSIDEIMDMLDWNNPINLQAKGCSLAKKIKCIDVFLQPTHPKYNKNVWDNCAKILSKRTDVELSCYLEQLMEWIKDMNWPGAYVIYNRLKKYKEPNSFNYSFRVSVEFARNLKDEQWQKNLYMLWKEREETGDGSVSPK